MKIVQNNKIDPMFSTSSLTDIVFLLLIFFVLTSNVVTPSGIDITLPKATSSKIVMQETTVTITKALVYFVNGKQTREDDLDTVLKEELEGFDNKKVVLHIDEVVPTKYFVRVSGIAKQYGASITIAVKPD